MLLASALTYLISGIYYGFIFSPYTDDNHAASREFTSLLEIIDREYIGEYNVNDTADAAMRAAVDSLGDRWSYYMTPDEYSEFIKSMNNQFAGIGVGVIIDEETGGMKTVSIYRGSPAERAGIKEGDVITHIDGESLNGLTLTKMKDLLVRPIGKTAELTVLRVSGDVEKVNVLYDLVFVDPVEFEMLDGEIGYIKIANFDKGAADGFISAVESLLEQGALAFIFDVRNNGGGRGSEMTRILDYLLPEGEIFISIDKSGNEEITWSDSKMLDQSAVVLVNRYSYSAAEYFTATLQEYKYAEAVGEHTTGKSRSQRTLELPGGGAVHISTGQYLTKNRIALYDIGGLMPDHVYTMTDEEIYYFSSGSLQKENDPQLTQAISIVKSIL